MGWVLLAVPYFAAAWIVSWTWEPSLFACLFMWTAGWAGDVLFMLAMPNLLRVPTAFAVVGGSVNAIPMLANGGLMPVQGLTYSYRWWQPLTAETVFPQLADIYALGPMVYSIGDALALLGILMQIGCLTLWLLTRPRPLRGA